MRVVGLLAFVVLVAPAALLAKASSNPATQPAPARITLKTPATAPATAPAETAQKFPTPGELIARMRAMKKKRDALPHVAYIDLDRPLAEKPGGFSLFGDQDTSTVRSVLDRLNQARTDDKVQGVLITLSSETQISYAQAQEIRDALSEISKAGKKTFVYADAYDTPAYTLATGADDICLLEGGEVMMPGVGMETMFAKGLLDKVGVKADYIQIGEYKGADEEYTRTTASQQLKGQLNKLTAALYEQIVNGIALHRKLSKDKVRGIIDEALLTAPVAKERGLIDTLTDEDGLRPLMSKALGGKKIELMSHYGEVERQEPDMSNPWSILAAMSRRPEPSDKPQIAVIYVDGVIKDGQGGDSMLGGSSVGSDDLRTALRIARRDDNIKAVVLRINSPGGSALASEVIWQAARHLAEKKPLIVSVGAMAASGGYYIASAGQRIFADPSAIVGSIGVVGGKFVWHDLAQKLGVTTETFSRGANADLFSSTRPFDDRQRKMVTNWMKQTYDQFTRRVMSTRGKYIKDIDKVARGRIFTAIEGRKVGLVDEIGGFDAALNAAAARVHLKSGEYDVRTLPAPRTLADYLWHSDDQTVLPIRPKIEISGAQALLSGLDGSMRRMIGQQLQAIKMLQARPVVLMTPWVITIR